MGSGLMGSYAAAASVDSDNDAGVRILRNRRDEGRWLVLLETPNGIEAPWQVIQKSRPQQVVRLERPVMLPREELLAGAQNPEEGLTVLRRSRRAGFAHLATGLESLSQRTAAGGSLGSPGRPQ